MRPYFASIDQLVRQKSKIFYRNRLWIPHRYWIIDYVQTSTILGQEVAERVLEDVYVSAGYILGILFVLFIQSFLWYLILSFFVYFLCLLFLVTYPESFITFWSLTAEIFQVLVQRKRYISYRQTWAVPRVASQLKIAH